MIYFIQSNKEAIKIGFTRDEATLKTRLWSLKLSNPNSLKILNTIKRGGPHLEKALHRKFAGNRIHGEWFIPTPELLQFVKNPQCEQLKIENNNKNTAASKNNNECKWCKYKWYGSARFQATCPWCLRKQWKKAKIKLHKKAPPRKKQFKHIINNNKFKTITNSNKPKIKISD